MESLRWILRGLTSLVFRKAARMLILSRKRDQVIRIGDDISVMVVEVRNNKVRLGIDAPERVRVYRQEVWVQIRETANNEHA